MFAFFGSGNNIPGVTSDKLTPGGMKVAGALTVGNRTASSVPSYINVHGATIFHDTPANQIDGDDTLFILQTQDLIADDFNSALYVLRSGLLNGHEHINPTMRVEDSSASTASTFKVTKQGVDILDLTTQQSITGALASVTDANAKAVLTSVIAALTGIKVATNDTT